MPYCPSAQKNVTHKNKEKCGNDSICAMWQTLSPTKYCKTCDIYVGKFDPHPLTWKEASLWSHTVCLVLQCFIITSWAHAGISYLTLSSKTCMFVFLRNFSKVKLFHSLKSNWQKQQKKKKKKKRLFCSLPRTWQECTLHSVFLSLITRSWSSTLPHNDYILSFERSSYISIWSCI